MSVRKATFGAIAGLCATMAMTAAMRRLHEKLPSRERYPLPPREITERMIPTASQETKSVVTSFGHFGYGAIAGALYACLLAKRMPGIIYGPLVWAASYLGWIPAAGILKPACRHPARRNGLMVVAHAVWGLALGFGLRELYTASKLGFDTDGRSDATAKPGIGAEYVNRDSSFPITISQGSIVSGDRRT